jgi:hypothetical protein
MPVTVVAGSSGGECARLARLLAAHATTERSYLLYPEAGAIPFSPPAHVTLIPVRADHGAYEVEVLKSVRPLDLGTQIFVEMPPGRYWSESLLAVSNFALVVAAPSQVSIAETLRHIRQFEDARRVLPDCFSGTLSLIGWDLVGGWAAKERWRAAVERAIRRDPSLAWDSELALPFWPLPPLHWTEIDYALGLADRPANNRVDDLLGALPAIWSILGEETSGDAFQDLVRRLMAFEPHSDATRIAWLADDLHLIDAGLAPTVEDLRHAPLLTSWRIEPIVSKAMRGSVVAHPLLGARRDIVTSPIERVDPNGTWFRSTSRFYSLGRPDPTGPDFELAVLLTGKDAPDPGQIH